jgi:hypothetical protein
LSAALVAAGTWSRVVTRRQALLFALLLVGCSIGYGVVEGLAVMRGLPGIRHPTMPYLGNVFYLWGLGPPTLPDVSGKPLVPPHSSLLAGVILTVLSTLSGIIGMSLLVKTSRRVFARVIVLLGVSAGDRSPQHADAALNEVPRTVFLAVGAAYLLGLLFSTGYIFDRYLMLLIPLVLLLALDAAPISRTRLGLCVVFLWGLLSAVETREYMAWNGARAQAVRDLLAQGIPTADIDGGFEVNGPFRFIEYAKRTGRLDEPDESWWALGARYHVTFRPGRQEACSTVASYPYWTAPGRKSQSIYVVHCP